MATTQAQDEAVTTEVIPPAHGGTPWAREGILFHRWLIWRAAWLLVYVTLVPLMRIRVRGRERIPKEGGALLLANHTTFMDFLICFWGVYRPAHGIGSEQVFRMPLAGWILNQLGGIPYSKGAKDREAVERLASAYEKGSLIGMFPEGKRSWTGRPLPIKAGTGRLVKSLGCPVIYCRVKTGFLQFPRWAKYPRWVPWQMEYSAPESFPPEATPAQINSAIARGLAIDPDTVELPRWSWGFRLAEGLPEYLWACPACFSLESLEVSEDRDCIGCSSCERQWRVDLRAHLNPETPNTPALTVATARERITDGLDPKDELRCQVLDVSSVTRGQRHPSPITSGAGRLTAEGVEISCGDEVVWSLPYTEMKAILLQFRGVLHIRVDGANYQLDPRGHSRLMWHHFILARAQACGVSVYT